MSKRTGKFITIEGVEGAGKSTVIKIIQDYLLLHNAELVMTREPGGTPLAEVIRDVVLGYHDEGVAEDAELLLFFASRAQHLAQVIKPALEAGKIVLCDRFTDASYAYQCGGRGISEERIAVLEQWVQKDLQPDLTILLDVPVDVGLGRIKNRESLDRIEVEEIQFFERVRANYLKRAKKHADRFRIFDATAPLEELKHTLLSLLDDEVLSELQSYE